MNIAVVYYSLTGNNGALAVAVAKELSAVPVKVSEKKHRKTGTIIWDMILNRTPRVQPLPHELDKYDKVLFVAPVWMGKTASPLRDYLKHLKKHPQPYGFASISGGALNLNPGLANDLEKRTGAKPMAFIDLHITDFLPPEPRPTMKATSAYRLSGTEISEIAERIAASVKNAMEI